MLQNIWLILIVLVNVSTGTVLLSDEDYKILPPVYGMDTYVDCKINRGIYCTVDLKVHPYFPNSRTWKLIEISKQAKFLFNHDTIHRAICIPGVFGQNMKNARKFAQNYVDQEVGQINLSSTVENITCNEELYQSPGEYVIEYLLYTYLIFVICVSIYHYLSHQWIIKSHIGKGDRIFLGRKCLLGFSVFSNWNKIWRQNTSKHYQKLKSIQGLRTLTCILIIFTHTKISYFISFLESTKYAEDVILRTGETSTAQMWHHFEKIKKSEKVKIEHIQISALFQQMHYRLFYTFLVADFFLVQVFFLISSWLLTVEVFDIYKRNNEFTLKNVLTIFINRCFRLWPVLLSGILLQRKFVFKGAIDIPLPHLLDIAQSACHKYWWASLFFVQNYFNFQDSCHLGSWYLAADVQLYLLALTLLYVTLKLKSTICLNVVLIISYFLFAGIIYFMDLDIIFRPYTEYFKLANYATDRNFVYLYTMTHVNSSTYILGICFGIIYYRIKDGNILNKKNFVPIWITSFLGLPPSVIYLASKEYKGFAAALVGPLLKPIFSFGIGLGILGMSMNTGGIIKKLLECRLLDFLSQFTYCTYIHHFSIVFLRSVLMDRPLKLSTVILVQSGMWDIFFAFLLGFIVHILIELPASNTQKLLIPQVKKIKKPSFYE